MTEQVPDEAIEERVLSGHRELGRLAAEGLLPLAPERLVPLQVRLASSADPEIAALAARSLAEIDPRLAAPILAADPDSQTLRYFAANAEHPLLLETILRRRDAPTDLLVELARRVPGELQDVLILRQDAIVEHPEILVALESNPSLEHRTRRRIREYREHLVRREPVAPRELEPGAEGEEEFASPQEVAAAVEVARAEEPEGEIDEQTGLSESQIRTLTVPIRMQLARGAGRMLRDILIRDTNPRVACAVLKYNSFSDGDIERISRMRNLVEDVLETIGRNNRWVRRYPVALALARNPRTPVPVAVGLVSRLSVRDLQVLRRDRNVSEAVRSRAQRLFSLKVG